MDAPEGRIQRVTYALLWILAFSIPIQDVIDVPGVGTISRLLGFICLASALVAVAASGRFQIPRGPAVAAFGFLSWATLSLGWTVSEEATVQQLFILVRNVGMFWMLYEFLHSADRVRRVEIAYVLGCWVCIAGAARSFATGNVLGGIEDAWEARFVIARKDPNDMASLLAIGIPISIYLQALTPSTLQRWVYRLYPPCAIFGIVLTGSRGGLLTAGVALLTQTATLSKRALRTVILGVVLIGAVLFTVQDLLPETMVNRFRALPDEIRGGTFSNRGQLWQAGLEVFDERPLLGIGAGAYGVAIRERGGIPEVTVAHNTALGVLVEMGPVGVLAFMAIPLLILWSARRLPPAERWLTWGVVVTWLSASMSLTWEANKTTWFSFGLFAAVATRPWIRWPLREELQRRAGLARSRAERWDTAAGDAT